MNKDILQGKWNEVRGKVKERWGKLTDDEIKQIQGKRDQLIGKLQARYGYAKDRAEQEVKQFETTLYSSGSGECEACEEKTTWSEKSTKERGFNPERTDRGSAHEKNPKLNQEKGFNQEKNRGFNQDKNRKF